MDRRIGLRIGVVSTDQAAPGSRVGASPDCESSTSQDIEQGVRRGAPMLTVVNDIEPDLRLVACPVDAEAECSTEEGLDTLQRWLSLASGKWSLPILDSLAVAPTRYNRLLERLDSVAPKVLTQTLRRLEAEELISAEQVGRAGRLYALTPRGSQLRAQLVPLRRRADDEARFSRVVSGR